MALPSGAKHSPDFSTVIWHGVEYSFTATQAAIVEILWTALNNDTPDVRGRTLLDAAGSTMTEDRIDPLFFRHAAWKTMIVRGKRRGTYRLKAESAKKKKRESGG